MSAGNEVRERKQCVLKAAADHRVNQSAARARMQASLKANVT